jgi:hypothetical protein
MDRKVRVRGSLEDRILEFLGEIRDEVCSRCSGRPIGDPRGNPCGVELPLAQLVEALEMAAARRTTADRGSRPTPSTGTNHRLCPCPMDRLADFAAEAAADLERRRLQRERLLELWDGD